ncbi:hypothetical protein [Bifidobacterium criceti]|uniref:Uncharacterized protein n=1 Tax=Bifidobacterium criceti TaxID=1960969 RepID=A0A2A2EBV8_9BIFI|nr:hypothetical protein [Bifidobacterium criceti]PAU66879.1 hypothetical protein B1526_1661 [Bifidobacterium criceti]
MNTIDTPNNESLNIREYGLLVEACFGYRTKTDYADNPRAQEEAQNARALITKGFGTVDEYGNFVPSESAMQWVESHRGIGEYSLAQHPVEEPEEWWESPAYVIPIPFWLTEDLESIRHLSNKEISAFETENKEPYVGYAIEYICWDTGWSRMSDIEGYALSQNPEQTWAPDPLEYYVACAKFNHEREWEAIETQMAAVLGLEEDELDTLSQEEYHKLFWEVADERRRNNPPKFITDDPLTYPYLQAEGYIEDLGEDGFRFLKRTSDMGLIQGQAPYTEAYERAKHDITECQRRIAEEEG